MNIVSYFFSLLRKLLRMEPEFQDIMKGTRKTIKQLEELRERKIARSEEAASTAEKLLGEADECRSKAEQAAVSRAKIVDAFGL